MLASAARPSCGQALPEPCPEGQFRDHSSAPPLCRYQDFPNFGAAVDIPSNVSALPATSCTDTALQALLTSVGATGGGIVTVPACTLVVATTLKIPSRVALAGAGAGQTVLVAAPSNTGKLLLVKRATNVRISDMTLDGANLVQHALEIRYSGDVIAERLEVLRPAQNGIVFYQSRHVTIRYNRIHQVQTNNGIGAKDCYLDRGDFDINLCVYSLESQAESDYSESECGSSYCPCDMAPEGLGPGYCFGYGSLFTSYYQVYSNLLHDIPNDYCLALHAHNGEAAGNLCEKSKHGTKTPDAWDIYLHHNLYQDNTGWGFFAYGPVKGAHPRRLHFYRNRVLRQGDVAIRTEGPEGLYLVDNFFEDNCSISTTGYCTQGPNFIVNNYEVFYDGTSRAPETYICTGYAEDALRRANQIGPVLPAYAESGSCSTILPLEVVDLRATARNGLARIEWITESEANAATFLIDVSRIDRLDVDRWSPWTPAGSLPATGRDGEGASYRIDVEAPVGRSRFRLRTALLDGREVPGPAVELEVPATSSLTLSEFYPNPAADRSVGHVISDREMDIRVDLIDANGRLLETLFEGQLRPGTPQRLVVEASRYPSGLLFVTATGGQGPVIRSITHAR